MKDFAMFTDQGNAEVARLVDTAQTYAGLDGPIDPVNKAWTWLVNELEALSQNPNYEEATDTAVREAAYTALMGDEAPL